jgi:hypothetical protein
MNQPGECALLRSSDRWSPSRMKNSAQLVVPEIELESKV